MKRLCVLFMTLICLIYLAGCSIFPNNNLKIYSRDFASWYGYITPLISYEININKKDGSFNQQIKIEVDINFDSLANVYFDDGPLYIKLEESSNYEIIGDKEFIIDDFTKEKYILNEKDNPIKIEFTVKPLIINYNVEHLNIEIKFQTDKEKLKKGYLRGYNKNAWVDLSKEYFYTIQDIIYVINNSGIHFSGPSSLVSLPDAEWKLFYECLNNEYENKIISEYCYMNYVIEFSTFDKVYIDISELNEIRYISKNIRAMFSLSDEYYYLIEKKDANDFEFIANDLMKILYEEGQLSLESYNNELQYIFENKITSTMSDIHYDLIPFDEYRGDSYFHYHIIKK